MWPGVTDLTDYKSTFPKWNSQDLSTVMKNQLPTPGVDVLKVIKCFCYIGKATITLNYWLPDIDGVAVP